MKFDIRTGREIDDDDDVLRDGQRIVVPLNMRDSMSPMQRAVAEDKAARGVTVVDGLGRPAGHRPGACYLRTVPHTVDHAVAVTQEHLRRKLTLIQFASFVMRGRATPTTARLRVFTIPAIPSPTLGSTRNMILKIPGTTAVASAADSAPAGPVYDAVEGQRVKDEAYRAMVND